VVAFVGLNPRQHQSGKKTDTTHLPYGRAALRAALYMPAIVAKRCNPRLHAWADQLSQRGLTGKQVIVALMRKLIHLAYAILKSGRAFDPIWRSPARSCLTFQTVSLHFIESGNKCVFEGCIIVQ